MEVRTKMTARGKMAIIVLDDGTAVREVTAYSEVFDANRNKIVVDEVLVIEGKVSNDDFSGGLRIVADKLHTLADARVKNARALEIRLNGEVAEAGGASAAAQRLQDLLSPFRAEGCPVRVRYRNGNAEGEFPLGDQWRVRLDDALIEGLREWLLEDESVNIIYR